MQAIKTMAMLQLCAFVLSVSLDVCVCRWISLSVRSALDLHGFDVLVSGLFRLVLLLHVVLIHAEVAICTL